MFSALIWSVALVSLLTPPEVAGALFSCSLNPNAAECLRDSSRFRHHYDGIDSFLIENAPNQNETETMKIIEDWIKRETDTNFHLTRKEAIKLRALVQLHNLVQTDGPGRCTLSSSRILQDNDLSLRGSISKLAPGEVPKRRIERLVNYYVTKFVHECDHEQLLKDFDPKSLNFVRKIVGDLIGSRARDELAYQMFNSRSIDPAAYVDQQPLTASNYAKSIKYIRPLRDVGIVYRWLSKLTVANYDSMVTYLKKVKGPDGQSKVDGNMVYKLYKRYLGKPCEQFVERVESTFGSHWALAQSTKLHKANGTEAHLYKNLAYYHGCSAVLHSEEKLVAALKSLISESK